MFRTLLGGCLLLFSIATHAESFKMPVEVVATAEDSVGSRLVYFVKEGINSSSTMESSISPEFGLRASVASVGWGERSEAQQRQENNNTNAVSTREN